MNHTFSISIKVLQVLHGDAIHVRFLGTDGQFHNIFVDGGFARTYRRTVRAEVEQLIDADERIDLFIVTHTDQDHIGGVLKFVKEFGRRNLVERYWFNHTFKVIEDDHSIISTRQGLELRELLGRNGSKTEKVVEGFVHMLAGMRITVLTPTVEDLQAYEKIHPKHVTRQSKIALAKPDHKFPIEVLAKRSFKEDIKVENRVSISLLLEFDNIRILFLADSSPSRIITALSNIGFSEHLPLHADCVKLSHHASKANTSDELISMVHSPLYIVSANGKNRYHFPHKEPLARILSNQNRDLSQEITFAFNYENSVTRNIFTKDEQQRFNFQLIYPEERENGIGIRL